MIRIEKGNMSYVGGGGEVRLSSDASGCSKSIVCLRKFFFLIYKLPCLSQVYCAQSSIVTIGSQELVKLQ